MKTSLDHSHGEETQPVFSKLGDALSLSNQGQLALLRAVMARHLPLRMPVRGLSMQPFILDHDILMIEPMDGIRPKYGDVVAFTTSSPERLVVHRVVARKKSCWLMQGDNCQSADGLVSTKAMLGRVTAVTRKRQQIHIGLGPERVMIAALNRIGILAGLRKTWHGIKRLLSRLIVSIQTLPGYRTLAKKFKPAYAINAGNPGDLAVIQNRLRQAGISPQIQPTLEKNYLIARSKKQVIGLVGLTLCESAHTTIPAYWLDGLYVRPRFRGMGIGEALTNQVISLAEEKGADMLYCACALKERSCIRLLQKLGFRHDQSLTAAHDQPPSHHRQKKQQVLYSLQIHKK